jgi:acyl-coenzyme A thioesterase PaaI-like protein
LMGHAVFTHLGDPSVRFGTSQMTTHFLRVVASGTLTGEGRVVTQNESYVTAEAEIKSEGGDLVATAQVISPILSARWLGCQRERSTWIRREAIVMKQ